MTDTITQDVKNRWIADLRSGKYQQARRCLVGWDGNSYCCLGVLAKITKPDLLPNYETIAVYLNDSRSDQNMIWTLVDLNDKLEKSFPEIADYIEENVHVRA